MHPFVETISIAGGVAAAIVGAIVVLTLFYRGLSWLSGAGSKLGTIDVRGVLKKDTIATIHLAGGDIFERVRFIGFTNTETMKAHLPFELNGMVILEDEQKTRFLVRAKNIKMIVVVAETNPHPPNR
ncbi:MAG: hypothetical protein WKF77_07545 [Planctomycetaceae bacterium]